MNSASFLPFASQILRRGRFASPQASLLPLPLPPLFRGYDHPDYIPLFGLSLSQAFPWSGSSASNCILYATEGRTAQLLHNTRLYNTDDRTSLESKRFLAEIYGKLVGERDISARGSSSTCSWAEYSLSQNSRTT